MNLFPTYLLALTASFVVLDATGKIDWPWWWVVMPLLIGLATVFLVATLASTGNKKK